MRTTKQNHCIGLGEILWDLLPAGKQLGGAPANFAYHAHAMGAHALVVSRVGSDALGREILDRLGGLGLPTDGISTDPSAPTGTVRVELDGHGKPKFTIHEGAAWDFELKAVALTKGAHGSSLLVDGKLVTRPGSNLNVVDTVGAGDSYTAALALGLLAGQESEKIVEWAHRIADYVCTQPGAMPPMPPRSWRRCDST